MRHGERPSGPPPDRAAGGPVEGGPVEGRARRWERLPYWIILAGTAAGLLWILSGEQHVRQGTLELAGVLLLAAVARMVLPERRAGMLGARRRPADVVALTALGIGLLVVGMVFPAMP